MTLSLQQRAHERREQNREAQRAFRARKEKYIKELEVQVDQLRQSVAYYMGACVNLQESLTRLQVENAHYRQQLVTMLCPCAHCRYPPHPSTQHQLPVHGVRVHLPTHKRAHSIHFV
jgi:hypothetical protein